MLINESSALTKYSRVGLVLPLPHIDFSSTTDYGVVCNTQLLADVSLYLTGLLAELVDVGLQCWHGDTRR